MQVSLDWIKEFVDLPQRDVDDLANDFIIKTAEVEEVIEKDAFLGEVEVVEIKSMRKHPEADRLNLVTFLRGKDQTEKEVVCGAPNVREGLKVPYAPSGLTLPGGFKLEPKKIRGFLSDGMLCSQKELGLGEGTKGLMELEDTATVGENLAEHLDHTVDYVLDIDNKSLTNRPDLWGTYGLAREFASIYQVQLKNPFDQEWVQSIESKFNDQTVPMTVKVDPESSCLAFWGLSIDGIKVEQSPRWMVERLETVGLRSINSIVDISNYVMLELGMPLHIYDRNLINGNQISIRKNGEDSEFTTLDEMPRKLIAEDTIIADNEKNLVLAGIMGGASSGVREDTKKVFIEVANWKAEEVRRTSSRIGLRTDSSARYEKSLDSQLTYRTLLRTIDLVLQLNPEAKIIGRPVYDGTNLDDFAPLKIDLHLSHAHTVLGQEISSEEITRILCALDFTIEKTSNEVLTVSVPSYRSTKDIECEADIIEELGRMIGYDNLPVKAPRVELGPINLSHGKILERKIQDFWSLHGQSLEIMTYPLVGEKLLAQANWPTKNLELKMVNSVSTEADRMRPSLIPSLIEATSRNVKNFDTFRFFELGRTYLSDEKNFNQEKRQVGIVFFSRKQSCFLELVNRFEQFLNYLKLPFSFEKAQGKFKNDLIDQNWVGKHPFEYLDIKLMGKFKGVLTSVHPLVLKEFKVKGHMSLAVLDYSDLYQKAFHPRFSYKALPKFPAASFDCTVLVNREQEVTAPLAALKKFKKPELVSSKIADVFELDETNRSVTLRFQFQNPEQTLDPETIKSLEDGIVAHLDKQGFPLKV